jgi:hypothetical protein
MTVSITSSLKVALVSGTGVTFSAPVVNLISTDDVYNPANPAQTLTAMLSNFVGGLGPPAFAEIDILSNVTATTLTSQNTWYQVSNGWSQGVITPVNTTVNATNGTITANVAASFQMLCALSFTTAAAPNVIQFGLFKNGALDAGQEITTWTESTTYANSITISGMDTLNVGDVMDLRARCTTAAGIAITVSMANFNMFSLT